MVLYYHGVWEPVIDPVVQALHLPLEAFDNQIEYLRKHYTIISIQEFEECLRKRTLHPSHLLLTFDDGYRNNLTVAAPLLHSRGIPFTVFISTEHIETGMRFPGYCLRICCWCTERPKLILPSIDLELPVERTEQRLAAIETLGEKMRDLPDRHLKALLRELCEHIPERRWTQLDAVFASGRVLTWDEVRELQALGATIGSHCHSHSILHAFQSREEIRSQVEISQKLIVKHLGSCDYFSYPHGNIRDISRVAYDCLKRSYRLAFTTISTDVGREADPLLVPRVGTPASLHSLKHEIARARLHRGAYMRWLETLLDENQAADYIPVPGVRRPLV
jgi:Polysaccharide deacetylase